MKCHLCVNYIEMQTDPANCDYVIVSGAQRKEERWDMEDNEQVLTTGERCGWVWTPQPPPRDGRDTPALVAREKGLFFRTVASEAHTSLL